MKIEKLTLYISTILFVFCGCNNPNNSTRTNNYSQTYDSIKTSDAEFAKIDSNLILHYKHRLDKASNKEKEFIHHLLSTMTQYQNKKLDTIILTFGLIDSDNIVDTIQTRVYLKHNTVCVNSDWIKNHDTIWKDRIKDPYLYISDFNLFQFDTRSIWVAFTIGVCYGAPSIYNINDNRHLTETAINMGLKDLKDNGFKVNKNDYKKYLSDFKGCLITWGQPMTREGLHIWYEPAKRFIVFYQP